MTRILLVDDHKGVRQSLANYLSLCEALEVVGEASNGAEAVEICGRLAPDVVVMDINMPVMDGIEATKMIACRYPEVVVIALTLYDNEEKLREAYRAGAYACLVKGSVDELANVIQSTAERAGKSVQAPTGRDTGMADRSMPSAPRPLFGLADSEDRAEHAGGNGRGNGNGRDE